MINFTLHSLSDFISSQSLRGAAADPTIPKRGEKDFAPDGTDLQSRVLAESREAMHNALSGVRTHTSKVNVHCTWRPSRGKAEVKVAKGTHFKAMGVADKEGVLWLEREEVVYLVERGGVECWWEEGIPMSLQGVYAECLGNAGAGAIERYQVCRIWSSWAGIGGDTMGGNTIDMWIWLGICIFEKIRLYCAASRNISCI